MQYHHIFHAGNFADVAKHVVLIMLLEALGKKEKPFLFLDTHAGIGCYDLKGDQARKTREYEEGIYRLWRADNSHAPKAVLRYLDIVRACNSGAEGNALLPRYYPGSPLIVAALLRPQDRMILTELHPADARALKREFAGDKQIAVHHTDGYQSIKAFLPPKSGRALTLMDPAFEDPDEFAKIIVALKVAFNRFPTGMYLVWYPVKEELPIRKFYRDLHQIGFKKIIIKEFSVKNTDSTSAKLSHAGLAIINPPFKFEKVLMPVWRYLQD